MGFPKNLFCLALINAMERRTPSHAAHTEHIHLGPLSGKIDKGFVPIDLPFDSPFIALWHKRFSMAKPQFTLTLQNVLGNRGSANSMLRKFFPEPVIDPLCRMPLLARSLQIRFQYRIDKGLYRIQPRSRARSIGPLRWQCRLDRLPD